MRNLGDRSSWTENLRQCAEFKSCVVNMFYRNDKNSDCPTDLSCNPPHFLCMNTSSNSDLKTVACPFIPQESWKVHFLLELVTWPSLRNDYVLLTKPATLTWRHYTIGYDCACAKAINSTPIWRRLLRKRGFIGCCGRIGERLLEDEPEGFCERSWNIFVILTLWVLTWT